METRNSYQHSQGQPREQDTILATEELSVERKKLNIQLRENSRGRFVRILETMPASGPKPERRNIVIIPDSGFEQFAECFQKVTSA